MISCSVAQAKHLSAQGIYVRSARHDEEGAPQVGSNHWIDGPEAIELPRAQATQHPEPPVALWPTCARPRQRPASSGQGQAMRRLIPCSMPACPHVIPLGSPTAKQGKGRFPYMWAIVTSAVYHPYVYIYGNNVYLSACEHPPPPEGVIISQPIFWFLGEIFDVDHDFKGP